MRLQLSAIILQRFPLRVLRLREFRRVDRLRLFGDFFEMSRERFLKRLDTLQAGGDCIVVIRCEEFNCTTSAR